MADSVAERRDLTSEALCFTPATELARLVRERAVSPVEITEAVLARIAVQDPALHAYITVTAEQARRAAAVAERSLAAGEPCGPLHGIPFSVKDLVFTEGVRTTAGSRAFEHFVPAEDSVVVRRLKQAGGILLGKTSTSEFGHKATTENMLIGDTRNPWAPDRTAGGSSGGAAAATAAGMSPLAIGTDAGGSIRVPASCCGVVGFKPTFGRVPDRPGFGGGRTIAHTGPITRTVADAALLMDVIGGYDEATRTSCPALPGSYLEALADPPEAVRVGYSADLGYAPVDPEVARIVADGVRAFEALGWVVAPADPGFDDPCDVFNTVIRAENHAVAAPLLERHGALLEPGMREFTENGAQVGAREYLEAQAARDAMTRLLAAYFERYQVLVTPTLAVAPFALRTRPQRIAGKQIHSMSWNAFTFPFNLTGNPAASVPCGRTAGGLPVGLQIVGPRHSDRFVLRVCAAFERLRPWRHERPPSSGREPGITR